MPLEVDPTNPHNLAVEISPDGMTRVNQEGHTQKYIGYLQVALLNQILLALKNPNSITPPTLSALTGNTTTTLDGQPVLGLTPGTSIVPFVAGGALQWWKLNIGTAGAGEVQSAVNPSLKWTQAL